MLFWWLTLTDIMNAQTQIHRFVLLWEPSLTIVDPLSWSPCWWLYPLHPNWFGVMVWSDQTCSDSFLSNHLWVSGGSDYNALSELNDLQFPTQGRAMTEKMIINCCDMLVIFLLFSCWRLVTFKSEGFSNEYISRFAILVSRLFFVSPDAYPSYFGTIFCDGRRAAAPSQCVKGLHDLSIQVFA